MGRLLDSDETERKFRLPWYTPRFDVIGKSHIIRPGVILPFLQPQDPA